MTAGRSNGGRRVWQGSIKIQFSSINYVLILSHEKVCPQRLPVDGRKMALFSV